MGKALAYAASLADRKKYMEQSSSKLYITDRSLWSTVVANFVYSNKQTQTIIDMYSSVSEYIPVPDIIIVLDVPYELCRKRITLRSQKEYDIMSETEYDEHMRFYRWLSNMIPGVMMIPVSETDTADDTASKIKAVIKAMQRKE